jgi:PAS domain S-box-containing protein
MAAHDDRGTNHSQQVDTVPVSGPGAQESAAPPVVADVLPSSDNHGAQANGVSDLRKQGGWLDAFFSAAAVGVAILAPDTQYLRVNDAFCQIVGYSSDELIEMTCAALTHPEDLASVHANISALLAGQIAAFVLEKRYIRRDGALVWARNNVSLMRGADGQPLYLVVLCQDITSDKRAEEARRESEEQLAKDLADTTRLQAISTWLIQGGDLEALYRQILDAAIAVMRSDMGSMQLLYPEKNALRLLVWNGFDPASASFWEWVRLDSATTCGVALRTQERVIVPDIETCDFMAGTEDLEVSRQSGIRAVQSTPLIARDGRLLGMISTHWRAPHQSAKRDLRLLDVLARFATDLMERGQAEEAAAHLAAIVTSADDAIVSKTLDGIITTWNASAERMFGYTAQEIIGQSILLLIPPDRHAEEDLILARLRAGERIEHFETVRVAKDGRPLDVSLTISPIRDSAGVIIGASKIARDITERKQAEEAMRASELALQEANQRKDEFLGIASHELRTPLTSIVANVQMARKQFAALSETIHALDAEPSAQNSLNTLTQRLERTKLLLERMQRQAGRLDRLVGDLIDTTRIQADKLDLLLEPCDLLAIVREAVQEQRDAWPHRSITLSAPRRARLLLRADSDRIGQVVANYLSNALKYSADDTAVAVAIAIDSKVARVTVRDQGPGLTAAQQEHLFERFYRVPDIEQQSGSGVGLGLGLHICQTIVERHSGQVGVESAPGEGSSFWFTLPLASDAANPS